MNQPMNININAPENKLSKSLNISEEQQVQIFAKQMLAKRLFVGHYQERRLVETLTSYRDVVCVSDTEDDLPRDLGIVKKRIQQLYPPHKVWTGITAPGMPGAPAGYCLWVKLNNIPFGHYWFQIREVKFIENVEICIRLKCIRPVNPDAGLLSRTMATSEKLPAASKSSPDENRKDAERDNNETIPSLDFQEVMSSIKNMKYQELILSWISGISILFTVHNIRQMISFAVVLAFTAFTAFFKFITYLGDFSIRVLREISVFVQVCTPIFLGIIDFFAKCVGGILILITVLWRGSPPNNTLAANFRPPQRALPAIPPPNFRPPPTYRQNRNYARPFQ